MHYIESYLPGVVLAAAFALIIWIIVRLRKHRCPKCGCRMHHDGGEYLAPQKPGDSLTKSFVFSMHQCHGLGCSGFMLSTHVKMRKGRRHRYKPVDVRLVADWCAKAGVPNPIVPPR